MANKKKSVDRTRAKAPNQTVNAEKPKTRVKEESRSTTSSRREKDAFGNRSSEDGLAANKEADDKRRHECVVVGIGASAGGLEAYKRLLHAFPADAGIALVLVQHLDPTHESLMVELLSKYTSMPVMQVEDATPIEPNHVYMIPPNRFIKVQDGGLFLDEPITKRGVRLPIDYFFRSLAEARQERAICVVLSGTGSDGAAGVREVKAAGGMTVVQQPDTAEYDGMPRAAMSTGCVDFVIPIDDMAGVIVPYAKHPYVQAKPHSTLADSAPDHFRAILSLLRAYTDQDFSRYKKGTLTRRIERRMGLRQIDTPADYLKLLREDGEELQSLFKDLLIGVTRFFRDESAWEDLSNVVQRIIAERADEEPFRIWVPACSTGEEAYSVAMLLDEQQQRQNRRLEIQVFATDIDSDAIDVARLGVYPMNVAKDVSETRLETHFQREGEKYRVRKKLRERCIFAVQNILSDPPFSSLDLICCRNLMIYLEPEVQRHVFDMMHFALKPSGLLFLGSSESPVKRKHLFETITQASRIYRKIGQGKPGDGGIPMNTERPRKTHLNTSREDTNTLSVSAGEISTRALLDQFAPASVVVNHRGLIQYIHGPVSNFLELPSGEPDLDLTTMCKEGLTSKTRTALNQARSTGETISILAPRVRRNGGYASVRLLVQPLPTSNTMDPLFLVSFLDEAAASNATDSTPPETSNEATNGEVDTDASDRQLAIELQATREDLQSTIEELESANEELKASNEEVMSMNEELQSTNEELETSREELQSLNEELSTVNNQLHDKVEELEGTTNDLQNLLSSTDMATLFLDIDLRIRRFTPATARLINVLDTDIGRPVSDLSPRVNDPDLVEDARTVLDRLTPVEKEVKNASDKWFNRRVIPFRTAENKIEGVVVTFADITRVKQASNRLAFRENQQAVIAKLGRTALASNDLQRLFDRAVEDIPETLGVKFCKLLRLMPEEKAFQLISGVGWKDGLVGKTTVPAGPGSQAGYTLQSATPIIVEDLKTEKRFSGPKLLNEHKIVSGMSVIIGPEEQPWGVLGVHSDEKHHFTPDDTNFVQAVANVLWEAIRRQEQEESLQRSELRWRFALEGGNTGAWELRQSSMTAWTSHRHDQIFGYEEPVENWSYERFIDHVLEEDRTGVDDAFKLALQTGESWNFECRILGADGQVRWIRASGRPENPQQAGEPQIWGLVEDITDRKQTEIEIARTQERTQLAMSAASLGFWDWNIDENKLLWAGAEDLYGVTADEQRGIDTYEKFLERVYPEDRDRVRSAVEKALSGVKKYEVDFRVPWPDGTVRWLMGKGSVTRNDEGKAVRMVGVNFDITARKDAEEAVRRSEERLRMAARMAQFGSYYGDVSSGVVTWSPELKRIFGLEQDDPGDIPIGKVPNFVHEEDRERVFQKIKDSFDPAGDGNFHDEHRILRPDGQVRWVLMQGRTGFQGKGANREPSRIAGVVLDTTERRHAQAELEQARRAAEAANESKSVFLANMSHEIRTPLTAILGYTDVLHAQLDDSDAQACLRTIKENGKYLCDIINDILDLSKIESGKMTVRRDETSLIKILADIRSLMNVRATEKSLALSVDFKGEVPEQVVTDPKMVRQVLVNLVGNAIKFTERGGVHISCKCLAKKELIEIAVKDTGIGISEEDLEDLFLPFEQLDNSFTRTTGGSGLGLAISKKLVEMLGGELKVESVLGEGSVFRFTFATGPLDAAEWSEPDPKDLSNLFVEAPEDELPALSGRILAADDRREIRFLVQSFLGSAGTQLVLAENGQEAVEAYQRSVVDERPFDAILLDMQMPVLDGLEAARTLRSEGYRGPIIALTANAMNTDREKCLEAGCDDFITKPIDKLELLQSIARHIEQHYGDDGANRGVQILCVDDSEATTRSQKILLERLGHRVAVATSGHQALSLLAEMTPDVTILDLGLREMSGGELLSQLKMKPELTNCRFICLSGRPEDEVDWQMMGFDCYLQKPKEIDEIDRVIRQMTR